MIVDEVFAMESCLCMMNAFTKIQAYREQTGTDEERKTKSQGDTQTKKRRNKTVYTTISFACYMAAISLCSKK